MAQLSEQLVRNAIRIIDEKQKLNLTVNEVRQALYAWLQLNGHWSPEPASREAQHAITCPHHPYQERAAVQACSCGAVKSGDGLRHYNNLQREHLSHPLPEPVAYQPSAFDQSCAFQPWRDMVPQKSEPPERPCAHCEAPELHDEAAVAKSNALKSASMQPAHLITCQIFNGKLCSCGAISNSGYWSSEESGEQHG